MTMPRNTINELAEAMFHMNSALQILLWDGLTDDNVDKREKAAAHLGAAAGILEPPDRGYVEYEINGQIAYGYAIEIDGA